MGSKNENKKNHNDDNKANKKMKNNDTGKGKDNSKKSDKPSHSNDKVIDDPRFSMAHTDPRFREPSKHQTKVSIDSRFDRMFTDKSFSSSSAPVDKRGKPKDKVNSQQHSLRHYYKMDEDDKKKVEHSSGDEEEDEEEEELLKVKNVKPEIDSGTESEESSDSEADAMDSDTDKSADIDTDTDTDDDGVDGKDYDTDTDTEIQEEVAEIEKETHRLAVVNMDWRYVKAADLYVLFSSLAPPNGLIKSVTIYPTEFGLQRIAEEDVKGPVALFDGENERSDEEDSDEDGGGGGGGDRDSDNEKLRAYEKSRMRYHFALVECDSSATADHIYKENDGVEFEHSSNPLDLRFIPDDMEFKQPPEDVATEIPANYENKDFYSRALQHSKVESTWDEDEPHRANTLKRKFTDEQLAQLEMNELIASDVSESDDSEDNNETDEQPRKKVNKYLALLSNNSDDEDNGGMDMEVTFNTGLQDISKHIMEKKDKNSRTVWEECLRKKREKKKARKNKSKYSSDDEDDSDNTDQEATEDADDFFMEEEPDINKKKKKKAESKNGKDHKLQDMDGVGKASKEELELLLADDKGTGTVLKGYNLKFRKGKGKKTESAIDEGKIPNNAFDDPRFASIFSPDFAIDPTDPQFKRSAVYARQLAQKQQKGRDEISAEREHMKLPKETQLSSDGSGMMQKGEEEGADDLKSKQDKLELSSMVKSIKMKSKQIQLSSDGNTRKAGKSQFKKRKH